MEDSVYMEQKIEIERGDFVIIYSDGLTEARNERGDFYGEQRLFELIPALRGSPSKNVGERILADVETFIGDARMYDDISIAVIVKT